MPRQLDFANDAAPSRPPNGSPSERSDRSPENDRWESVDNRRKSRQQRALDVQPARPAAQNTQRQKMMWREGMTLAAGRPLPGGANARANLTAFKGVGTIADPKVCWNIEIQNYDQTLIGDYEALVRIEARRLDCTMVVIRGDVHNTTRSRNNNGDVILVEDSRDPSREVAQLEKVDDHLTVFVGISLDDVRVQGHVFVKLEHFGPDSNPSHPQSFREMSARYKSRTLRIKGKLPSQERQYVQPGHGNWSEEFYELGSALSSNRRNHEIVEKLRAQYPPGTRLRQNLL